MVHFKVGGMLGVEHVRGSRLVWAVVTPHSGGVDWLQQWCGADSLLRMLLNLQQEISAQTMLGTPMPVAEKFRKGQGERVALNEV